jgi:thiol-disulfide isomerase/thioredoxin
VLRNVHRIGIAIMLVSLAACTPSSPSTTTTGPRVRFVSAGDGDVPPLVRSFVADARADGRVPLVYVGATWCEPCRYFHRAAERGELDPSLPRLSLLEFDRDRDGARLDAAGYSSRMIPLFVVPGEDGRATSRRIEGSIHGPESPAEITPRLRVLLEQ